MKSSFFLLSYLTFTLLTLMMIYPVNISNIQTAKKSLLKGFLWAGFIMTSTIIVSILVLGSGISSKCQFPTYILAKEVNVGIIITRVEFIVASSWIASLYIITVLFFYAGVKGLSQLLGLKDYKRIVVPMGIITIVFSGMANPDAIYKANWVVQVYSINMFTHGFIIPVIMLLVYLVKKWVFKRI